MRRVGGLPDHILELSNFNRSTCRSLDAKAAPTLLSTLVTEPKKKGAARFLRSSGIHANLESPTPRDRPKMLGEESQPQINFSALFVPAAWVANNHCAVCDGRGSLGARDEKPRPAKG
jgi:hypothetical protein